MIALHAHLPGAEDGWIRPLRRAEYDRLVEAGVFDRERVELIRGVMVRMPPRGAPHAGPIQRLTTLLVPRLVGRADVRVQLPVIAPDESEPEPDLALVAPGDYDDAHPSAAFLIVEVADSSLAFDRATKAPLYAAMGVPEYWIVNVRDAVIEVHRQPKADHYVEIRTVRRGESLGPLAFPDVVLEASAIIREP